MTDSDAPNDPDEPADGDAPDVLVAGETLVDFLPDGPDPLADVETFARRAGGAPANVAVALARLGERPWFWTRVGEDPFGDYLVDELAALGIPDRFVERDPDAKTALAFVSHDTDADREFTFYRDGTADAQLEPGGVPDEALDAASFVALGGVMLAADPGRTATLDLAERAAERDCTVLFDPNARPELWASDEEFADLVGRMLEYVDVVKATPTDLAMAGIEGDGPDGAGDADGTGDSDGTTELDAPTELGEIDEDAPSNPKTLADAVTRRGPHTVLLTLGEAGAFAAATDDAPWGQQTASHRGYDVDAVDATGAGDAFTAAALAAFADGETSLSEVLGFANAVAAVTTTERGAMVALPTREQVEAFRE